MTEGDTEKECQGVSCHGSDDSRFGKWRVARYSVSGSGTSEDEDCGSFGRRKGEELFGCVKKVLREIYRLGGRCSEKDLFDQK